MRALIVGCGYMGREHFRAYQGCGVEVVACCDIDIQRAFDFGACNNIPVVGSEYMSFPHEEQTEIVSICTPPETHFPIIEHFASLGRFGGIKGILCEKPATKSLADIWRVHKILTENPYAPLFAVDYQRHYSPEVFVLKEAISKAKRIEDIHFGYRRGIYNQGSHMFDLYFFLMEKPLREYGRRCYKGAWWEHNFIRAKATLSKQQPSIRGEYNYDGYLSVDWKDYDFHFNADITTDPFEFTFYITLDGIPYALTRTISDSSIPNLIADFVSRIEGRIKEPANPNFWHCDPGIKEAVRVHECIDAVVKSNNKEETRSWTL